MKVKFVEGETLDVSLGSEDEKELESKIKEAMERQDGEALLSIIKDIQKVLLFQLLFQEEKEIAELVEDTLLIEYIKVGDIEFEILEE